MSTAKLKPHEAQAAKQALRVQIDGVRESILAFLTTNKAIPQSIVDGAFSQVVEYKNVAIAAAKTYHVLAPPRSALLAQEAG